MVRRIISSTEVIPSVDTIIRVISILELVTTSRSRRSNPGPDLPPCFLDIVRQTTPVLPLFQPTAPPAVVVARPLRLKNNTAGSCSPTWIIIVAVKSPPRYLTSPTNNNMVTGEITERSSAAVEENNITRVFLLVQQCIQDIQYIQDIQCIQGCNYILDI